MSKVVIAGDASGTGTFTISAPNGNTDRTLVLPDEAGTIDTLGRAGNVLQVVSATKTDTFSRASQTFGNVTGLSVTITPSSTNSKILIFGTVHLSESGDVAHARFARDGVGIAIGDARSNRIRATVAMGPGMNTYYMESMSMQHLDSPSSTSALTYTWQIRSGSGVNTVYVNRSVTDRDTVNYEPTAASSIIVMEIAG